MSDQQSTSSSLSAEDIEALGASLRGELTLPDSDGYDAVRLIWNGMFDKKPALIARCNGTADVIAAVNFAREKGLLTAVRCGGHNSAGSGSCDGGILIDLSDMNAVHVDPKTRRARVQGGATWGDFDREAQIYGLATPGGLVSATGVAGLSLAGGVGWLRGKFGLCLSPPTVCCAPPARMKMPSFSGASAAAAATSAWSPRSSSRFTPSARR
jgi:FAD/FMN-containing dehydrogenase